MKFLALAMIFGLVAAPVLAGPPATAGMGTNDGSMLLSNLAWGLVVGANCKDFKMSAAETKLFTETAAQLAKQLDVEADEYAADYTGTAQEALKEDPSFCDNEGDNSRDTLQTILGMGGKLDK